MKLFLDLHVLQTVPPSCLNRDDTGSPKMAIYGGVRRARVSSQAWKRAMRLMFKEHFNPLELSTRTKFVFNLVAQEIMKLSPECSEERAIELAQKALKEVGVTASVKKGKEIESDALFFMSAGQARSVAAVALGEIDKNSVKKALKENRGVDLALFGRMVAADAELNSDACAQVAHAISTHRVENEYDYFTAVDDLAENMRDDAGAAHLGTVEYNSATLYRYATVAVHGEHGLYAQLANNTDVLEKALREFARAFICSIPTGKQNTFAAHTLPDAVLAAIRVDRPLNLVGAFEKPVRGDGLVEGSAKAFADYAKTAYEDFCAKPEMSYVVGRYLDDLGERLPLDEMLIKLSGEIAGRVTQ